MSTATQPAIQNNGVPAIVEKPKVEYRVVEDHGPLAYLLDTARFEHLQRVSTLLASASLTPAHLKGNNPAATMGNCFQVVNQSLRWGLDPFAVAAETYVVQNKLGFQGKLIAALINSRANLSGRLRYEFDGAGDDRTVTVIGRFDSEEDERVITLSVKQGKTTNKMWTSDPDQKLVYSGATKWARRHCPEIMLGVLTDDDLERIAESREIVSGPVNEVMAAPKTLGDMTNRLKAAATPELEPEKVYVHREPVEVETEQTQEAEQSRANFDSENFYNELSGHLDSAQEISVANKCLAWAADKIAAIEDAETRDELTFGSKKMVNERIEEIKSARGAGSNPKQRELGD